MNVINFYGAVGKKSSYKYAIVCIQGLYKFYEDVEDLQIIDLNNKSFFVSCDKFEVMMSAVELSFSYLGNNLENIYEELNVSIDYKGDFYIKSINFANEYIAKINSNIDFSLSRLELTRQDLYEYMYLANCQIDSIINKGDDVYFLPRYSSSRGIQLGKVEYISRCVNDAHVYIKYNNELNSACEELKYVSSTKEGSIVKFFNRYFDDLKTYQLRIDHFHKMHKNLIANIKLLNDLQRAIT